jgi:hypothetical protein
MRDNNGNYTGPLVSGYNARLNVLYGNIRSLMGPGFTGASPVWPIDVWPDSLSYGLVFQALSTPPVDPEIVVISGFIEKNGKVTFAPFHSSDTGFLSESDAQGDVSINTLNSAGQIIGNISLRYDTIANLNLPEGTPSPGTLDLGTMPFAVSMPSQEVATIQITREGQELVRSALASLELISLVDSIPLNALNVGACAVSEERCLIKASKAKQTLLKLTRTAQNAIDTKRPLVAALALTALKVAIEVRVKTYSTSDPLDLSKAEILQHIKDMIYSMSKNLRHRLGCRHHHWRK